ncbi:unnamed protein product [Pleuronectes platessa]|uniref:Uncharacterized protein n=1 Tax=Pleuronectes platessa TaxID=8262 RepID=A0A9N7TTJ0_PLEPL|nr:unnamed protein product [Pleuronectes platessa]
MASPSPPPRRCLTHGSGAGRRRVRCAAFSLKETEMEERAREGSTRDEGHDMQLMCGGREAELDVRLRRAELDWNQGSVGGRPSANSLCVLHIPSQTTRGISELFGFDPLAFLEAVRNTSTPPAASLLGNKDLTESFSPHCRHGAHQPQSAHCRSDHYMHGYINLLTA